jgi:beta-phosphoglucomutase
MANLDDDRSAITVLPSRLEARFAAVTDQLQDGAEARRRPLDRFNGQPVLPWRYCGANGSIAARFLTSNNRLDPLADEGGWLVEEDRFDPARQRVQETVFSVGNGYFATRGSLEEGHAGDWPATLAHGVFAPHPLVHSELANLTDWTALDVRIDGQRFSQVDGEVLRFRRTLDLRNGLLRREVTWRSPKGQTVELVFERFVSLAERHIGAVRLRVTAVDFDGQVEVHSRLNARTETDGLAHTEWHSQTAAAGKAALGILISSTHFRVGFAMRLGMSDGGADIETWDAHEQPTLVARWAAAAGQSSSFEKIVTIVTSRESDDPMSAATGELDRLTGADFDGLLAQSASAWRSEWGLSDVVIEGDPEAQLAIRFSLYQLLISAPRNDEQVSIGAKGLVGFGYRGHVFWDLETFMLPFFIHVHPEIARNLLSYRYHRLPGARHKAIGNGLVGAQFPWESAETGEEVTPTFLPDWTGRELVRIWTGDIAIHISAEIAHAIVTYWRTTGDDDFLVERGAEVILESARFWVSRAEWNAERERYEFSDVLGPDENHEHVNNNAFTNYLAAWHLRAAAEVGEWLNQKSPGRAHHLLGDEAERNSTLAKFRQVADKIYLGRDKGSGVIEQFAGYFELMPVDLEAYADRTRSMQDVLGLTGVQKTQVLKQPDVLMVAAILPDAFTPEELIANYDYYSPRTDHAHGSSLGPGIHALLAARLGRVEEAYEHFLRAARVDLQDIRLNTEWGLHAASAGALWQAIAFGFAGLAFDGDQVTTTPHLPAHWQRLAFRVVNRGRVIEIDLHPSDNESSAGVRGLIFDLDGVVTNTSELHYQAWQQLADEEGLPFSRKANEALRGISRRESLALVLGARSVTDAEADEMMARKNGYYRALIAKLTPADVLPGVLELIDEARERGLKIALGSASKNAREVLDRLDIARKFDAIEDGNSVPTAKPAPDLFLACARSLGLPAQACIVFEDATDGIAAAQAAGMMTVGIGPQNRVGKAEMVLSDGFAGISLATILDQLDQREAAA